jgi:hypothetical protein
MQIASSLHYPKEPMLRVSTGLPRASRRRVSPWTKPRLRLLRRRWAQGARVREIAAELGHGISSNAVIAKIHRLGIAALSPYGGRPGRRSAGKPRAGDWRLRGHRIGYWFRQRPAAGLGCKRKTSPRNYAGRRAYPAPPAPLAGRIERKPLPMAGRRSAVFPLLLLWGAAGTEQALLRRALRARVPGCTRDAARHCAIAILRAPSTSEQNRQGNRRSNPSGE